MNYVNVLASVFTLALLSGCSGEDEWGQSQQRLVGMTYRSLVDCAGPADAENTLDSRTGTLRYRNESTQVVYWSISGGQDQPFQAACDAFITVKDGRVVSVSGRVDKHGFYDGCTNRFSHCLL